MLDSNRITRIVKYRQETLSAKDNTIKSTPESNEDFTDEYGEIVRRKITKSQKQLNNAEISSIIAEYKGGASTYALSEKYGCHRNTISRHLKSHGIEVTNVKLSNEQDKQKIVELYNGGLNTVEIAKQFSISRTAVKKLLHDKGVQMRTRWDY